MKKTTPNPQLIKASLMRANQLQEIGLHQEAEQIWTEVLKADSQNQEANYQMGRSALRKGPPADALPFLKKALAQSPKDNECRGAYLDALIQCGNIDEARKVLAIGRQKGFSAEQTVRFTTQLSGDKKNTAKSLSVAKASDRELSDVSTLINQGRTEEAIALMRTLTAIYPNDGKLWHLLGMELMRLSLDAEKELKTAHSLLPKDAEIRFNLGALYSFRSDFDNAQIFYQQAIDLNPNYASAHAGLGVILLQFGFTEKSTVHLKKAAQIEPNSEFAHAHLGSALARLGDYQNAYEHFRMAINIDPQCWDAYTGISLWMQGDNATTLAQIASEQKRLIKILSAQYTLCEHRPRKRETIHIGFISSDIRAHPVAEYFEPLITYLKNITDFSLYIYYTHIVEDDVTARFKTYTRNWRSVATTSTDQLVNIILRDEIDILIELNNMTHFNRLDVLACKPAPVQVSWVGYPPSTGLSTIDYRVTDNYQYPKGEYEAFFSEKLVYLPATATAANQEGAPSINGLPALENGFVTFGSFNGQRKLNRHTIALWSKIMRELPDAKMLIGAIGSTPVEKDVTNWFLAEGIALDRLRFSPIVGRQEYFKLHHEVDFCLDCFPENAATTNWLAICMGVPTLTLAGVKPFSRCGVAINRYVGLDDFVVFSENDYLQKAIYWSKNLAKLAEIRTSLRYKLQRSIPANPTLIGRAYEEMLRRMWKRWCDGLPAESFEVREDELDDFSH